MTHLYLNPPDLFPSEQYGFSQGVVTSGGRLVFLSGQVGWNADQEMVGPGDLRAQTWESLRNVERALHAAGGTLADVVALRIYIRQDQLDDTRAVSDGLKAFFPAGRFPAATWLGVPGLANEAFLIEIEATAVIA